MRKKAEREEQILLSLDKLDYLSRSQLQKLHNLGTDRNASRVMQHLEDYVSCFRHGENVYYLNANGRERVNSKKVRKKTLNVQHYLMRNAIYIAYNQPKVWKPETPVEVPGVVRIIPDALFKLGERWYFVEADHTQKMTINKSKVEKYRLAYNDFKANWGYFPKLIWITSNQYRKQRLEAISDGLTAQVYTYDELK